MKTYFVQALFLLVFLGLLNPESALAQSVRHVTNTGVVYVLDGHNPKLGIAYRDPRGLVWGSGWTPDGWLLRNNHGDAVDLCASRGARLPTVAEFQNLADDMGKNTPTKKYSPFVNGDSAQGEMIQGLSGGPSWTTEFKDPTHAVVFQGWDGIGTFAVTHVNLSRITICVFETK